LNWVWISVGYWVWDLVWRSVRDSVRRSIWDWVWDLVWHSVGSSVLGDVVIYGQHDASWLAAYDYFREVLGLYKETEPLYGLFELAKSANWELPYANICFVSECPAEIHQDDRWRLHNETGPALRYPDGWSIWAWHGIRVPQRVIEQPLELTVQEALKESNADIRRVMFVRIGGERLAKEMKKRIIDRDLDVSGHPRELFEIEGIADTRFVSLVDMSGKHYPAAPVPPQVNTCAEAVAWRHRYIEIDPRTGRRTKANWLHDTPQVAG